MDRSRFPDHFLFGAATAAYQVEGSPLADGAGPSIWHRFSHTPGLTFEGHTGDVACDHYRRWSADVDLMAELGLQSYRFSLAWGRILPEGRGRVNAKGLDFYSRLTDRLLQKGITPMVTLYHWDLPAALDDRGGWLNPDVAEWFADYAEVAYRALGDRVPRWATLNEPWVVTDAGYVHGVNAPGHRNLYEAPLANHHLLLAHGAAVDRFRATARGEIGLVVNLEPKDPATDDPRDHAAARRADAYNNRYHLDAALLGRYPEEMAEVFGDAWPAFPAAELERIRRPIDFVGVNWYTRRVVRHDDAAWPERAGRVKVDHATHMETGWEVRPEAFGRTLRWVRERYGDVPVWITENGACFYDPPEAADGRVDDPLRVRYLRDHLREVRDAIRDGVDIRGYYCWSLLDNLEWARGYSLRFGLVHVDFASQRRTPKASAAFYRDVIRTRGAALDEPLPELVV